MTKVDLGWARTRIKYIARVAYGLGQPPPLSDHGIPIIRATNIRRGEIVSAEMIYAQAPDLPLHRAPLLKEGEILVVRSGAYTGDSALVTSQWSGSAPGYDLRVSPAGPECRFVSYSLLGSHVLEQIELAKSRAAQPHINAEDLGDISIDLPSLEEQRRVVKFLDDEMSRIREIVRLAEQQESLLKERRRALIDDLFSRYWSKGKWMALRFFLRPSLECQRAELPVLSVYRDFGVILKSSRQDNFNKTPDDIDRYLLVRVGDVVINKMKAWQGSLGVSQHDGIVSPDYLVARPTSVQLRPDYLHYLLRAPRFTAEYAQYSRGIRPAQWRLYWEDFARIQIPLLSSQDQADIVSELERENAWVEQTLDAIQVRQRLLAEKRQALITAAVTGQIDVTTARGVDVS